MIITCTDLEWGVGTKNPPETIDVDLSELSIEDVTEANSSEIAEHIADQTGEHLISFQYKVKHED